MLLKNKNAVIYGGGGAIARAFAREGARVFLAGRTLAKLDAVAKDISAAGGVAETAQVDALDEQSVRRNRDADLLCGFEIDDELEFRWLLDRNLGGLCSFQDLVHAVLLDPRQLPLSFKETQTAGKSLGVKLQFLEVQDAAGC